MRHLPTGIALVQPPCMPLPLCSDSNVIRQDPGGASGPEGLDGPSPRGDGNAEHTPGTSLGYAASPLVWFANGSSERVSDMKILMKFTDCGSDSLGHASCSQELMDELRNHLVKGFIDIRSSSRQMLAEA